MGRGVPLHRRPRVVPAHPAHHGEHVARVGAVRDGLYVVVERLDVAELLERGEREVGHPDLLALVDVGRPAVQVQQRGQAGRRVAPVPR
jgi:hypothetical protein